MGGEGVTDVTLGEVYRGQEALREAVTSMHRDLGSQIAGKADKSDLSKMEGRLDSHERQLAELRQNEQVRQERAAVHRQEEAISNEHKDRRAMRLVYTVAALASASGWVTLIVELASHHHK